MKKYPSKFQSIFVHDIWVFLILFCYFAAGIKICSAGQSGTSFVSDTQPPDTPAALFADVDEENLLKAETNNRTNEKQAWEPPTPPPDQFDWIQLTSGEWLKGELKSLYEKKLEFDSEKLKLLEFDWKDVKQVRCPRIISVRLAGPMTVDGTLQITERKIIVSIGDDKKEYNRDQLVAIAPSGEKEKEYWSGKISFGFDFTKGNTNQTQYSANLSLQRRTSATRLMLDYFGSLTETDDVQTVNSHRIQGDFDVFKTKKYYYRPVFGEIFRDPLKNIKYRLTLGTGMGYHLIDTPKTTWEVAGGPACQTTRFISVEAGEDSSEWTPALLAGTVFDTELTDKIDFVFKYTFQILNESSGTYTHHSVTTLETELTEWLDFDTSLVWDRVQDPTPNDDGSVPKKNDIYLMISLGIDF